MVYVYGVCVYFFQALHMSFSLAAFVVMYNNNTV